MKKKTLTSRLRAWLDNLPISDSVERSMAALLQVILIGFIFILILANGAFAMTEAAVMSSRKERLQQWAKGGNDGARIVSRLQRSLPKHLAAKVVDIVATTPRENISDIVAATISAFVEREKVESQAMVH